MVIRAGMFTYALAFLLGVIYVQQLATLPGRSSLVGLLLITLCICCLLGVATYLRYRFLKRSVLPEKQGGAPIAGSFDDILPLQYTRYITLIIFHILLIIIGYIYTSFYAESTLSHRLDEALAGKDIVITGEVVSVPVTSSTYSSMTRRTTARDSDARDSAGSNNSTSSNSTSNNPTSNHQTTQRMLLRVASARLNTADQISDKQNTIDLDQFPELVRLSWRYGDVHAGERWQLQVRLKPPHGFINPGGFDYEAWLFQQGIQATGYVRKSKLNQQLPDEGVRLISVNRMREYIAKQIDLLQIDRLQIDHLKDKAVSSGQADSSFSFIKALAIGDKSSITSEQWQVLAHTGTSHLMAISGLHIGLASLFSYLLVRYLLPLWLMKRVPAQHVALLVGLVVALMYAMVAGMAISTQRAFIMLAVLVVISVMRRNIRPVDSLGAALLLVLIVDPLAVLSAGFWFSFSAVAVIFLSLTTGEKRLNESEHAVSDRQDGLYARGKAAVLSILGRWLKLQLSISLLLLPLSLYMFQQGSLVSPLANLVLIPYVSFLVVPLVLLALVVLPLGYLTESFAVSDALLVLAESLMSFIWPLLSYLAELPFALWVKGDVSVWAALLATAAMVIIYFSKPVAACLSDRLSPAQLSSGHTSPGHTSSGHISTDSSASTNVVRLSAIVLLLPMLYSARTPLDEGGYRVTMLDVGQGSAAVIVTSEHVMIFDTGARFGERLDAGKNVIIPYLRSQGIDNVDRLVISHGDADHIGGAHAILQQYPDADILGQDLDKLDGSVISDARSQPCMQGQSWEWDGVYFSMLSPESLVEGDWAGSKAGSAGSSRASKKRNNRSCVLRVSSSAGSVLLTGDIERIIEQALVEKYASDGPDSDLQPLSDTPARSVLVSDILMVPHHGSKTSSSASFIESVDPEIALLSAGYKNRYRLPSKKVLARYSDRDIRLFNTASSGAVTITLREGRPLDIRSHREQAKKYWHHVLP